MAMTNSEKAVTWGLLALIAYELYRPSSLAAGCNPPASTPSSGQTIPGWVQQLSFDIHKQNLFVPVCGIYRGCS